MNTADELDALHPDPDRLERLNRLQLSALLDGELGQDEARFLRRRLEHDAELSGCFERWQVCGDVLRGRQVSLLPPDFAERIARGIAAGDGAVVAPVAVARRPRLLRWGGGAALAASVALVALFVGRPGAFFEDADDAAPLVADAAPVVPAAAPAIDATADASALTASPDIATAATAASVALAVAEAPRRSASDRASRGQSQRAAVRNAQARQESGRRVATAAPSRQPVAPLSESSARAFAAAADAGVLPQAPAVSRPWPKASALSANSSFSVRYGDGFAAPSWDAPPVQASNVLPSFPVDPADAAPTHRPQLRVVN